MKPFFRICALAVALAASAAGRAAEADFADVDIDEVFHPFLTARKRFMEQSGVKVFALPDGGKAVVCVVSTRSKGTSAAARAAMYKVCRVKAQSELLKADGYELSALSRVESRVICVDDGKRQTIRSVAELLDIAEEKATGEVRSWPVIGTWYSLDGSEFYLAIGCVVAGEARR